jgi:subtilisin family serine protease
VWKIRVYSEQSNIKYHMWLPISEFLSGETYFVKPDPDVTVCEPGNSRRAVSLSAYNPANDAFYLQASRGFTPNGMIKPDVTAPGVNIYGPLPKNNFGYMTGTSVAAAMVTGIAALFMQQYEDFYISGNSVRELLIRGAQRRGEEYPNREWGYGVVDAFESLFYE